MDLFEYQGKQLFARYDIPVSPGEAVTTVEEAVAAADRIGYPVVVKAQVQVGGRGKAGGIKLAADAGEARSHASDILGMDIKGHTVGTLWVEKASDIAEEYYASFTLDRAAKLHLGMLSARGGVDIEQVAEEAPGAIARLHIDPVDGLSADRCREWVQAAQLNEAAHDGAVDILLKLYRAYTDGDADLVEINPLILTDSGRVHALDAKVSLDSNAAFRHPEWDDYEATQVLDAREREARAKGLQYIGLDGSVGVICNGAGMTMATLDVVNEVGGRAANFLDVGGGAGADVLANAVEVVNNDPEVRAILINIFGGITKCDEVALGVVEAMTRVQLRSPMVVRLDGTNAAEGRIILNERASDMLVPQPTMLDAARKAVELAGAACVSIFVDETTKVVYQGLTGSQGSFYGLRNRAYGTQVVAGTNPKKAGTDIEGIPIFATVADARDATGATVACVFIPAPGVESAVLESARAGIELIVVITEGVPAHDEARFYNELRRNHPGTLLLGPNCPGVISPGKCNIGITPGEIALPGGPVGIVSRSGTLTYQALHEMTQQGIGQTTCVGIGGDPVPGVTYIDCLSRFEADPDTQAVIMIGEIGGSAEEEAAEFIKGEMSKPVVAYIAGVTAPAGKKMGHAGAIVSGNKGTAAAKIAALEDAGCRVARNPTEIGALMAETLGSLRA